MVTSRFFGMPAAHAKTTHRMGLEEVKLDLNLEHPDAFGQPAADAVDGLVDELAKRRATALAAITAQLPDPSAQPLQFWEFHRDELEGFAELGHRDLLSALRLKRVGLYPEDDGNYAVFDFVIDRAESDQLLVVHFDRAGTPVTISWES